MTQHLFWKLKIKECTSDMALALTELAHYEATYFRDDVFPHGAVLI
jgi:hypothetical protein